MKLEKIIKGIGCLTLSAFIAGCAPLKSSKVMNLFPEREYVDASGNYVNEITVSAASLAPGQLNAQTTKQDDLYSKMKMCFDHADAVFIGTFTGKKIMFSEHYKSMCTAYRFEDVMFYKFKDVTLHHPESLLMKNTTESVSKPVSPWLLSLLIEFGAPIPKEEQEKALKAGPLVVTYATDMPVYVKGEKCILFGEDVITTSQDVFIRYIAGMPADKAHLEVLEKIVKEQPRPITY